MKENCVIQVENLSKEYRLGIIGSGTLRRDLQSKYAKMRGREDPNRRIGAVSYEKGETFLALNKMNIEIMRGERVGIIGPNGAGKSTFLKLLARITSPSEGKFSFRGRIASMLEVGTGFSAELTGRENIYLNGAILGMTKAEIAAKEEDIIEFSEVREFIDTPVKRYSSGMFVKLAFAVAAHLDAEILIMDEVLAVGDMRFQRKCVKKMRELAEEENRTILYVSHNMNTIQELCSRCVVLEKGKKIYDGSVEEAIRYYLDGSREEFYSYDYIDKKFREQVRRNDVTLMNAKFNGRTSNLFIDDEKLPLELTWKNNADVNGLCLRIEVYDSYRYPVTSFIVEDFYSGKRGKVHSQRLELDISRLTRGRYYTRYVFYTRRSDSKAFEDVEICAGLVFRKQMNDANSRRWNSSWGSVMAGEAELK